MIILDAFSWVVLKIADDVEDESTKRQVLLRQIYGLLNDLACVDGSAMLKSAGKDPRRECNIKEDSRSQLSGCF